MESAWEQQAIAVRNQARERSRVLRATLKPPVKVPRSEAGVLRAGVARVDITPSKPMYLDGYWSDRLSTRVHDPLSAKALVLDDGRTRIAIVVADLIAYYYQWVTKARALQDAVAPENVIVCTTHTHSCPCLVGMFGPLGAIEQDYIDEIGRRMAKAIEDAAAALRPVKVGFGEGRLPLEGGEIPFFARNWHNPGVLDTAVLLMRLVDAGTEEPVANIVNLGNHTDVLGEHSTEVSSDFLGYVYDTVTNEFGGETLAFQRGLGGVEPIPQGVNDMREAEPHLRTVSEVACAAIRDAARTLHWCAAPRLTYRSVRCEFPMTSGEALKAYAAGLIPVRAEGGAQINEMALIEIGPAQFLTVPGEPHPEVIFKLTDMMRDSYNFVLAMAQDEIGYVVPAEIFNPAGIQELLSTGRDNELVVLSAAAQLLGVQGFREPACFSVEAAPS